MSGIINQTENQNGSKTKNEHMIRVAIVDDHSLFRTGIKTSIAKKHPDIQIVAEAENGLQLLNLLKHIQPDVILLDIQMPIMDGLTALPEIKKLYPHIKVIILTFLNDHSVISKMMDIGANSFITKECGSDLIYEAIRGVYENDFYFNEKINKALLKSTNESYMPLDVLFTDKEVVILKLMYDEKSTKEIADMVDLSPRTVEAICDKMKTKTGTKSLAGLFMYAIKSGIIDDKMHELIDSISKEKLESLFVISNSILSYINHDLAGQKTIIYNSLDQLKEEFQNENKDQVNNIRILELIGMAFEATKAVSSINSLIKTYVNLSRSNNIKNLFNSSPALIVESIKKRNEKVDIKVLDSLITLRIIYPKVILLSILSEFTENAKKITKEGLKVVIKWTMKGNIFQCEIHDNGPGFKGIKEKQNIPMSMLELEHMGMGLKIIERTLIDSKGLLFFSKSDLLGGAKIYFEFPVFDFTSEIVYV